MNDPKAVVNRLIEDVVNAHRPDLADEVLHPELTVSRRGMQGSAQFLAGRAGAPGGLAGGLPASPVEGFKTAFAVLLAAFPDLHNEVVGPQVVDGDLVVTRVRFTGTHDGEFFGVAPTGRRIDYHEVMYQRVTDGRISEVWAIGDELGFLRQLGVLEAG